MTEPLPQIQATGEPKEPDSIAGRFSPLAWALTIVAIFVIMFLYFGQVDQPAMALFVPVDTALMVLLTGRLARAARNGRASDVLVYLEQAVRANLPIVAFLQDAGRNENRKTRARMNAMRLRLENGWSISESLAALPEIPRRALILIGVAERIGRLPQALARLLRERQTQRRPDGAVRFTYTYPLMMLLAICTVVSLIGAFDLPKFRSIMQDFKITPPWITLVADQLAGSLAPLFGLALLLATLMILGKTLADLITSSQLNRPARFGVADDLLWVLPFTGAMARNRGLADVFDVVGDAMESGRPMDEAAAQAAELDINRVLRRKVQRWAQALRSQPPADAARMAELPSLISGMLAAATTGESAVDAVRFVALHYRTRFSRAQAIVQAAAPAIAALGFGIVVAGVALSVFLPLVALINHLAPASLPL